MARVILHIGQSKTGTTAIQHFLESNRDALRQAGVLYPDIHNQGIALGAKDHNLIAWALIGKPSRIEVSIKQFFSDIDKAFKQDVRLHTVILSAEAFMGEPHIWNFKSEAEWRAANVAKVELLYDLLQGHEVSVFAYLRRQDHWVNSAFNQLVKTEGLIGRQLYANIHEFIENIAPRLDYAAELDVWARCFGESSLIVCPYEKEQFFGGDVVTDFCIRIGRTDIATGFARSQKQEAANPSLPREIFEFKRILNRVPKSKPEERVLIWILQKIGLEMPSLDKRWDFLMNSVERNELLHRFKACNMRLAERFGQAGRETFFCEPLPLIDNAGHYPGLSVEVAAELSLRLYKMRTSFAARRLFFRYILGDILRHSLPMFYWMLRPIFNRFVK